MQQRMIASSPDVAPSWPPKRSGLGSASHSTPASNLEEQRARGGFASAALLRAP